PPLVFSSDTATTAISTLSLHDALPIFGIEIPLLAGDADDRADAALRPEVGSEHVVDDDHVRLRQRRRPCDLHRIEPLRPRRQLEDRKSTRLNSSHVAISYAVFCLKKKK